MRSTVISLLLVAAGAGAFALLAREVGRGATRTFDEHVLLALRRSEDRATPVGPPWVHELGRDLSAVGSEVVLLLVVASVVISLWLMGRSRPTIWILAASLGGFALSQALKEIFNRPRPAIVPPLSWVGSASFPSGHSLVSASIYLTLALFVAGEVRKKGFRVFVLGLASALTFLVGLSRCYLGVHWPTDVLAGWSAGFALAVLCRLVLGRPAAPTSPPCS